MGVIVKSLIKRTIGIIEAEKKYIESNSYLDNFYDFIGYQFSYNEPLIIDALKTINSLVEYDDGFLKYLVTDIIFKYDLFELKPVSDYWILPGELFSLSDPEQEIMLHDEIKSTWIANYIEHKTDCVINQPSNLAYVILHNRIVVQLKEAELLESIEEYKDQFYGVVS